MYVNIFLYNLKKIWFFFCMYKYLCFNAYRCISVCLFICMHTDSNECVAILVTCRLAIIPVQYSRYKYNFLHFSMQEARKGVLFIDFPPVLQLQLKRFEYDFMRDTMVKVMGHIGISYLMLFFLLFCWKWCNHKLYLHGFTHLVIF